MELDCPDRVPAPKRGVGRPRRLSLAAIVDAACEIGLADLEMALVAARLNTGVATLYGYVRSRDHLLELVVERLAGRALVADCGQSWQELIRDHAASTYALFESLPHLITNLIDTSPDAREGQYAQVFLEMLDVRGLPRSIGVDLYIEVNQAVIGAAVSLARRKRVRIGERTGDAPPVPEIWGSYHRTLERIIAGYEENLADIR